MSIPGIPEGYCDVVYADTVNLSDDWVGSSDVEKEKYIGYARVYFDGAYSCIWDSDDGVPDCIKTANAMLAEEYLLDSSKFFTVDERAGVTGTEVAAGPVKSKSTFDPAFTQGFIDRFPFVTNLVGLYCSIPNNSVSSNSILRR